MNKNTSQAIILMSTYNGEKYLAEQIDSIISQTYHNWTLLIRDDGSSDNTVRLIKKYCDTNPQIIFVSDTLGNLKTAQSFSVLMVEACKRTEPFIFFADQDDVWLPHKLQAQIALLEQMSASKGSNTPLLVHSDLCVVNAALEIIHPSFLAFEKLKSNRKEPLKTLLIHNYITGCTIGMNRALLTLACPVAQHACMHDWWCGLYAGALGSIGFITEPTVLYRQHENNDIGSTGFRYQLWQKIRQKNFVFLSRFNQAAALLSRLDKNTKHFAVISDFCNLTRKNTFSRPLAALRQKLQPQGIIRKIGFYILLISLASNK